MHIIKIVDRGFAHRFTTAAVVMALLNLLPLVLTWGDFGSDRFQTIGCPMPIYSIGGLAGVQRFSTLNLIIDLGFAATISFAAACCLRRGTRETLRRLRAAGTRT